MNTTKQPQTDSCLEVIDQAVADRPGILNVSINTGEQTVAYEYDSRRVSPAEMAQVAHYINPALQKRWESCTVRLGKQGGRACESCALLLEKNLQQLPGVHRATASYNAGVLRVMYDQAYVSPQDITRRVEQLGVVIEREKSVETAVSPSRITPQKLEALFTAITLVAMITGLVAEQLTLAPTVITVAYVVAYITGGTFGLKGGLESLRQRTIDIDLLMILAAVGAAIVGQPFEGAMLLFLFSLSNVLQDYAMDRTRSAIKALMKLRPNQATVRRGDKTVVLPIEKITIGDHILVKPGERIALDGVVVAGESAVDQSSLTGESMPVDKQTGDKVFAGTINKNGSLDVAVTKLAKDSTLARLIQMVEEAQSEKAGTQRFIDTAEQYYAVGVIVFTALAATLPLLWGEPFATAFYRAMTIMVAASPCALVISTPATVLSAIGNGARRGVLFKGGIHVENAATVKVVAFDKTGTLTIGKPQVTDVALVTGSDWAISENDLLALAASAEAKSEHPLAQAVVQAANNRGLQLLPATNFLATTGKGVQAIVNGQEIRIGNARYFETMACVGWKTAVSLVNHLQSEGKTSVLVAHKASDGMAHILGVIAFADVVRPISASVVRQLKTVGVERVVMLTGDNQQVADRIGAELGVDEVHADLLPENKLEVIKKLQQQYGPVAMVGDGVNDAPALATATIGIAMGAAGTDVALETADIVLMSDDLQKIPYVIGLSRQTRKTLAVNLGFAMFMILLMLATIFTVNLPLPLAVIGHEGGTVLVSLNGLRLLAYRGE